MMRCLYSSLYRKKLFFPATWIALFNESSLLTNRHVAASTGKGCASRFTSASLDTTRGLASTKSNMADRMVWLDMEMTGLDVDTCHIMEIACLVTDADLEIVSDDFHVIIHQPDDVLDSMHPWCIQQHAKSGLTAACRASQVPLSVAEQMTYDFLVLNVPEKKCPIAGNTVWMDRIFLKKYMPIVDEYAHYRIIDVSAVKELARRWCPQIYKSSPTKLFNHRALDDIRESINELKYYKSKLFNH